MPRAMQVAARRDPFYSNVMPGIALTGIWPERGFAGATAVDFGADPGNQRVSRRRWKRAARRIAAA